MGKVNGVGVLNDDLYEQMPLKKTPMYYNQLQKTYRGIFILSILIIVSTIESNIH